MMIKWGNASDSVPSPLKLFKTYTLYKYHKPYSSIPCDSVTYTHSNE